MDESSRAGVEVLWRPGCPSCSMLRRGLRRAGVATVESNIWTNRRAAARVRAATGGGETVPTVVVVVGNRALVNPSVAQVVAAVRAEPDTRSVRAGVGWTAMVALVWVLLAVLRPTTTWHLAPVLLAAAWPWVNRPGSPHG